MRGNTKKDYQSFNCRQGNHHVCNGKFVIDMEEVRDCDCFCHDDSDFEGGLV